MSIVTCPVINLATSGDARALENVSDIIQQEAMREFFKHVSDSQEKANEYRRFLERGNTEPRERFHDTILISGARGVGKSTFILSMFEMLRDKNKREGITEAKPIEDGDIYVLGILDPTLIEEKEHIFVHILSLIKEHVDKCYERGGDFRNSENSRKSPCRYEQGNCRVGSITDECYREWLGLLHDLAAGLPSIDGVGLHESLKNEKWHDPEYVLETGLRNTKASHNLEFNFHRFIDRSLRLLSKKAFIIGFDDIDTHFQRGWPLLEIIRKYLTTPQLITVILGDMELYSILVRSNQWKNFGKVILEQEKENQNFALFNLMVNKLEEQYLLKLFKPMRRIELKTIHQIYKKAAFEKKEDDAIVSVQSDAKRTRYDIKTIIEDIAADAFNVKGSDKTLYVQHILRDSLRTILRLVKSYLDCKPLSKEELSEKMIEVLIDIYHVQLMQYDFDIKALRDPDPKFSFNKLMFDLAYGNLYKRGYRLKADSHDDDYNRLMLVVGAVFTAQLSRHPSVFFDYFIKVGLTREAALLDSDTPPADVSDKAYSVYKNYCDWVGLWEGETAISIARLFNGYINSFQEAGTSTVVGIINLKRPSEDMPSSILKDQYKIIKKIYGKEMNTILKNDSDPRIELFSMMDENERNPFYDFIKETSKIILPVGSGNMKKLTADHSAFFFNTLEDLEARITSWHRFLITIPCNRIVGSNRTTTAIVWSIHGLISVLDELLQCSDIDEMKSLLVRASQLRDYPQLERKLDNSDASFVASHSEYSINVRGKFLDKLIADLLAWKDNYHSRNISLPIHVVARTFTRFYYALGRLDSDVPDCCKSLGNVIHRFVVIFLNSVLVEECLYNNVTDWLRLDNPISSDEIFNDNFKALASGGNKSDTNSHSLWRWIIECPLWQYYLDPSSEIFKFGIKEMKWEPPKATYLKTEILLFHLLNSVIVTNFQARSHHEA